MRICVWCGASVVSRRADARYCSTAHRVAAHRLAKASSLPAELTDKSRWVRRTASKVPITVTGGAASSMDPNTWSSYSAAHLSSAGVGLGFVLGDGIACIDLDHVIVGGVTDPRALEVLREVEPFYTEISPSGDGIHAWLHRGSPDGRSKYKLDNGLPIEWYSHSRYITITGNIFRGDHLATL